MTIFIVFLALLTLVLFVCSRIAPVYGRRMAKLDAANAEFHRSIQPLLDDPGTPLVILEMIRFLNHQISRRGAAVGFLHAMVRAEERGVSPRAEAKANEIHAFLEERPELGAAFTRACVAALKAMSYRSLVAGFLLRRVYLFDAKELPERPVQLVRRFRTRSEDHGRTPPAGALPA